MIGYHENNWDHEAASYRNLNKTSEQVIHLYNRIENIPRCLILILFAEPFFPANIIGINVEYLLDLELMRRHIARCLDYAISSINSAL